MYGGADRLPEPPNFCVRGSLRHNETSQRDEEESVSLASSEIAALSSLTCTTEAGNCQITVIAGFILQPTLGYWG